MQGGIVGLRDVDVDLNTALHVYPEQPGLQESSSGRLYRGHAVVGDREANRDLGHSLEQMKETGCQLGVFGQPRRRSGRWPRFSRRLVRRGFLGRGRLRASDQWYCYREPEKNDDEA